MEWRLSYISRIINHHPELIMHSLQEENNQQRCAHHYSSMMITIMMDLIIPSSMICIPILREEGTRELHYSSFTLKT